MTIIRTRAAETHAERSCHRSLALPRVWTPMFVAITMPDSMCTLRVQPLDLRCHDDSCRRKTRGNKVRSIVKARRDASKIAIGRLGMADHRIERVDRFVGHRAGYAPRREPEQRGDDTIAGALSEGFNDGARNLRFVEMGGIAADDTRKPLSRQGKIACFERMDNRVRLAEKGARR